MRGEDSIHVTGQVVEMMEAAVFRVELSNGHRVVGHVAGRLRMNLQALKPGDRVTLEMSAFDLTRGRIVGMAEET